jgi:hypothetical protein
LLGNTASGVVGIECGCQGPNYGVVSACASGSHCIGEAMGMIRQGGADIMLAGGTEASVTPLIFAGFNAMKAMNTEYNDNPQASSRPFDAGRGGFVMGEGAGVVVLESLASAKKRGADIYCELVGYGATCDAHHITTPAPGGRGLAKAMELALQMAAENNDMKKEDVTYLNAHGTSTNYNDKFETMAIKSVFGEHATQKHMVVSSTKCVTGHTLAAAGGLEAIVAAMAIKHGVVPPTINYETPQCQTGNARAWGHEHQSRIWWTQCGHFIQGIQGVNKVSSGTPTARANKLLLPYIPIIMSSRLHDTSTVNPFNLSNTLSPIPYLPVSPRKFVFPDITRVSYNVMQQYYVRTIVKRDTLVPRVSESSISPRTYLFCVC